MKATLVLAMVLAAGFVLVAQLVTCVEGDVRDTVENVAKMLVEDEATFHEIRVGVSRATYCLNAWNRHLAYELMGELESRRQKELTRILDGLVSDSKRPAKQLEAEFNGALKRAERNESATIRKLLLEACTREVIPSKSHDQIATSVNSLDKLLARTVPISIPSDSYYTHESYDESSDEGEYDYEVEEDEDDEMDFYDESESQEDNYCGNVQTAIEDERKALDVDKRQFEDLIKWSRCASNELEKRFRKFERSRRAEIENALISCNETGLSAKEFRGNLHAKHQETFKSHKKLLDAIEQFCAADPRNAFYRNRLTVYLFERRRAVVKGKLWMKYKQNEEFTSDFTGYFYHYGAHY